MKQIEKIWLLGSAMSVQLITSECQAGGGGLFGLFVVGDSGVTAILGGSPTSGSSGSTNGNTGSGSKEQNLPGSSTGNTSDNASTEGTIQSIATVHHPEPASLALFGGGLISVGLIRRRKARRKGPRAS